LKNQKEDEEKIKSEKEKKKNYVITLKTYTNLVLRDSYGMLKVIHLLQWKHKMAEEKSN